MTKEMARILGDCRDLAIHRLLLSFTAMLDRVGDMLLDRADKSAVHEEQIHYRDARDVLKSERANLMADFERHLRERVEMRMSGRDPKADFAAVDARNLTLIDTTAMDESVVSGNITRVVENLCQDELLELNRAMSYLLGEPELEIKANPLAPATIVEAFGAALRDIKTDQRIRFTILKELNQASLGDINAIYADLNRHLQNQSAMPNLRPTFIGRGGSGEHRGSGADRKTGHAGQPGAPGGEIDLMSLLQRLAGAGLGVTRLGPGPMSAGEHDGSAVGEAMLHALTRGPLGGPRILVTPELGDALTRLQQGETGFDVGGIPIQFGGVPQDMHNVLRDLQDSPLGAKANQLEAMTIELVAMLFDFIFETKDLPDSIKALIGRLQIPVLKAAMLDGAFFSKKSHPSRLMVNAMAHAGIGWSPAMGHEDPLYKKMEQLVHRVLDEFTDNIGLFDELRLELEAFLAEEEKGAEINIQSTAEEINQRDRHEIAQVVSKAEIERRLEQYPTPNFFAGFLRDKWLATLGQLYLREGEESEGWSLGLATLDDLVWSVQPKRSSDERKKLVALLPSLLKRLHAGLQNVAWPPEQREAFMSNLVEAHAASVKPSLASVPLPTAAVAEAAAAAAEQAKARGDAETAAKAQALAEAMAPAPPPPEPEPEPVVPYDHFAELAGSLERGTWIEFEGDDGQLAFAKLAWVSPLRGTYLFTNRQGQKAVSLSADQLAERFRNDRARLVEAEPLVDRAFTSMMATLEEKFAEPVT